MNHPPAHTHRRTPQILRGVAALAVLVFLLAGIPAGLYLVGGSPIPQSVPSWAEVTARLTQPDTDNTLFLAAVRLIGWAAWAIFTATTLAEAIGFIRGHSLPRLPAPVRPLQHLARDLIATAALIFTTTGPIAGSSAATAGHQQTATIVSDARTPAHDLAAPSRHAAPPHPNPSRTDQPAPLQSQHTWRTATIRRGDTLWAIARHAYGSGTRYPTIFNASKHLHQPNGLPSLRDPNKIFPGQRVNIPAPADRGTRSRPPAASPRQRSTPPSASPPTTTPPNAQPSAPQSGEPASPSPTSTKPAAPTATPPHAATTPPTPPGRTPPPDRGHPIPSSGSTPPTRPPVSPPAHTPAASASPTPHTPPTAAPPESEQHHDGPITVTLRTGGYVGLGLATMISIALAATRLHRRHRRTHAEGWPPTSTPDPPPPPPAAQVRKAHLDAITDQGDPVPSDEELINADFAAPTPTHLTIGVRDRDDDQTTDELTVNLSGLSLALTGPGAPHAARAILTELLARSRRSRVELLIPQPDAAALLTHTGITPTQLADAVPGLILTPSLTSAVAHLEAEFVHRARLMETLDEPDVPALRVADPAEPLPALVLIATVPDHPAPALQAILQHARPYCVGAVLLGTWPTDTTVTIADDGTVTHANGPSANTWTSARLFHITPGEATGLLHVVRTANGAHESEHTESANGATPPGKPATATEAGPKSAANGADHAAPAPDPTSRPAAPGLLPTPPSRAAKPTGDNAPGDQPVQLRLLGAVQVQTAGTPITTGLRRAAYDLLAYLALNPDGITRDQAIDAIWPDKAPETGAEMWHTAITNIRRTLRTATGLREPMFIIRTAGRYRLDPNLIEVDLRQLLKLLNAAELTDNDTERLAILRKIPELYTAELATDLTYEWAETHREHLRRHGTDALVYLARLTQNDNPDQALAALEQAITHDPYAEPLYRAIMSIQARLGRPDAARRTYQLLETRLTQLDVDPSEETRQFLLTLLGAVQ
jgi:DNA-binding SARP family transcriptional activator